MNSPLAYDAISRQWQERADAGRDYTVIRNDNIFRSSFSDSYIFESDFRSAGTLLASLVDRYGGIPVEDAVPGTVEETGEGTCYRIDTRIPLQVPAYGETRVKERLLSELTLIWGIGNKTEGELKKRGYRRIPDLVHHRKYQRRAAECLSVISDADPETLTRWVSRKSSPAHPLSMLASGLFPPERLVFLDLETLGFFSRPIILFGIGRFSGQELVVSQYLLRGIEEELPSLLRASELLGPGTVAVTYNGKSFDIPYLRERLAFYGEFPPLSGVHFDLLHHSRRRWKDRFPDCRLSTLEKRLFGVRREEDVPSAMVPEFYETYLRTGNPGPLVPIVTHNCQDVVSLARLFALLSEECHECA
ncbi:uncharacterized protein YprB with RNaseH-like and TPR domain [Methanolinea mesophila]|uniref:ribonuclease H-like domain-containing protein n=1 Tax=Methanolinea mesophila TaxID=547055 RepID=UPI001AE30C6A|nr:ribonuclease H-like domain-containing protein [Methanolinea mesophila]MBP1928651.1 uncharacterized protein YprB with RNaseH-like and TPR domain [Methanolinea mesophila]